MTSLPGPSLRSASLPEILRLIGPRLAPWLVFGGMLVWRWRVYLFDAVPSYGDALEVLWGIDWYAQALTTPGVTPFYYPLAFYPEGWYVATFAAGPGMFFLLLPLHAVAGLAFAYNGGVILSYLVAFAGMYLLARSQLRATLAATVAALLFTFWGYRFVRAGGHLNVLLGSALMPWLVWAIERAVSTPLRRRRRAVAAGLVWAASISISLYFFWLGGLLLLLWTAGRALGKRIQWREAAALVGVTLLTAIVLSAPLLYLTLQGYESARVAPHDIHQVNQWGASINILPLPFFGHPVLQPVAQRFWRGPGDETHVAGLGLFTTIVVTTSVVLARKERRWVGPCLLLVIGLLLSLGLTLKWDGRSLAAPFFAPLNDIIWQIGHISKPAFFPGLDPPTPFDTAVPLPAFLLTAILPYFEAARVLSRYLLVAAIGFFLLAAYPVARARSAGIRYALALLLLFEVIPNQFTGVPFPAPAHPAFSWLAHQDLRGEAIVDLYAPSPDIVDLPIRGATIWAITHHGKPTVAGASSTWPEHTVRLRNWLWSHPQAFLNPELVPLLRSYGARLILLHMDGPHAAVALEEATQNRELGPARCFEPPAGNSPWNYPICALMIRTNGR